MKKLLFLLLSAALPIIGSAQSQDSEKSIMQKQSNHLWLAGDKLSMSAKLQFASIGTAVAAGGFIYWGTTINVPDIKEEGNLYQKNQNKKDKNRKKAGRTTLYCLGAASGLASLACEIMSIERKLKAGRELRMHADGNSVGIAYNF